MTDQEQNELFNEGSYSSLNFLHNCTNEELAPLVKILSESKTSGLNKNTDYKEHTPNHTKYVDAIIDDYEKFGGNSIANTFRGYGVGYTEILKDVCKQMKVNFQKDSSIDMMELALLTKITEEAIDKMSPEELKEFAIGIDPSTTNFSKQAVTILAGQAIRSAGFKAYLFLTKMIYIIGTKILGKAVPFVVYQTSAKWVGAFAGPVGIALTAAWTVVDIAGPAYRVTIPSTIYIAALRQAKKYEAMHTECPKCKTMNEKSIKFCPECGTPLGNNKLLSS
ncbi:MAG: hypothetical protein GQ570_10075 [Helicobacteraceae bacterium]|nr:hypothetical protein [Helicobacteraceae bacterium]